jgi:flagellar motor switch protein FliM
MSDVLSQSEIDELLNALNSGDVDVKAEASSSKQQKKIKAHDFRRPSKFAKDHLKTFNIIYENYARLLNNYLSAYLRAGVQIEVLSVEPLTFYEFNNSISNPAVLGIVNFSPLPGSVVIDLSPNVAFSIIDRVLGGGGVGLEKVRGFTDVEIVLVEKIMKGFVDVMKEPWETIIDIQPRLEKIETNVQFAQLMSPNEIIALVTLSIKIGDAEGMVNICIPHMVVEPVLSKLSTKFWFSTVEKGSTKELKATIHSKIEKMYVPIKAILGKSEITVNDFLELREGDVLPLETHVNAEIQVKVGELLKFYARPGVRKNKTALKISRVILREED